MMTMKRPSCYSIKYKMENSRFTHPEIQKEKRKKKLFLTLLLAFLIITPSVWYVFAALNKNPPQLMFTQNNLSVLSGQTAPMPWPAIGQAAIGSTAEGVVATSSTKTIPAPTASIAKVITVLAVVQKLELKNAREQLLTLGPRDVAIYNNYKANDGSTVQVADGEQINLYDAFETMLLPSANNMADSVALWAFGSQDNYAAYANAMVRSWGLTHTTIGSDASGFSPSTLSTPSDLVVIGCRHGV